VTGTIGTSAMVVGAGVGLGPVGSVDSDGTPGLPIGFAVVPALGRCAIGALGFEEVGDDLVSPLPKKNATAPANTTKAMTEA
jgi:hypothetical protein